jgi:hypothetical protein
MRPGLARFTTPDPLYDLAEPQSLNPYSYSANNPVTNSDPSGLACVAGDADIACNSEASQNPGQHGGDHSGSVPQTPEQAAGTRAGEMALAYDAYLQYKARAAAAYLASIEPAPKGVAGS